MFYVGMIIRLIVLFYMVKFVIFLFRAIDEHGH